MVTSFYESQFFTDDEIEQITDKIFEIEKKNENELTKLEKALFKKFKRYQEIPIDRTIMEFGAKLFGGESILNNSVILRSDLKKLNQEINEELIKKIEQEIESKVKEIEDAKEKEESDNNNTQQNIVKKNKQLTSLKIELSLLKQKNNRTMSTGSALDTKTKTGNTQQVALVIGEQIKATLIQIKNYLDEKF